MGIAKYMMTAAIIISGVNLVGSVGVLYFVGIHNPRSEARSEAGRIERIERAHRQAYQQALIEHVDTDHDGLISKVEADEFEGILINGIMSGRINYPNGVHYKDGAPVPIDVSVRWIENRSSPGYGLIEDSEP